MHRSVVLANNHNNNNSANRIDDQYDEPATLATRYVRGRSIDWSSFQIAYYTVNAILHITLVVMLILSATAVVHVALPVWIIVAITLLVVHLSWTCMLLFVVDQSKHRPFMRTLAMAELCNAFGWFVALMIVHISRSAIASERAGEYALLYAFSQIVVYLQYALTGVAAIVRSVRRTV
jgi:hypothetical protein